MREFQSAVYLDLQKTGTTSIVEFLRTVLRETEVEHAAHSSAAAGHDASRFHFISVRHPLSLYISLFGHGVSGRGGLFKALTRRGQAEDMYEPSLTGFTQWLEFMLDPENAGTIRKRYERSGLSDLCGPLSHRLMDISIVDSRSVLAEQPFKNRDDLLRFFHERRLYEDYIRTENLVPDLLEVFETLKRRARVWRRYRDFSTAEQLGPLVPRNNVGAKIEGLTRDAVPQELQDRVRDREWLFYDVFGYDTAKGAPPPLPPALRQDGVAAVADAPVGEVIARKRGGRRRPKSASVKVGPTTPV